MFSSKDLGGGNGPVGCGEGKPGRVGIDHPHLLDTIANMPDLKQPKGGRALGFATYAPLIVGGILIVLCWIPWLAAAIGDVNVLEQMKPANDSTRTVFFWIGIGASITGAAVALKGYVRGKALMNHGVEAEARVASVGSVARNGLQPVTFAYVVDGREYTLTRDVPCGFVEHYTDETRLPLVYNPDNPGQAEITDTQPADYVAPGSVKEALKEGAITGLIEGFGTIILGVLLVANIAAAYGVARLFGAPSDLFQSTRGVPVMCGGSTLMAIEMTAWRWSQRHKTGGLQSIRWPVILAVIMLLATIGSVYLIKA